MILLNPVTFSARTRRFCPCARFPLVCGPLIFSPPVSPVSFHRALPLAVAVLPLRRALVSSFFAFRFELSFASASLSICFSLPVSINVMPSASMLRVFLIAPRRVSDKVLFWFVDHWHFLRLLRMFAPPSRRRCRRQPFDSSCFHHASFAEACPFGGHKGYERVISSLYTLPTQIVAFLPRVVLATILTPRARRVFRQPLYI